MAIESTATLLVIDDSQENIYVLSGLLRPQYRVLAATSGEAGLRLAECDMRPDLILLDVMMPGMDGYEVLAKLRENPATREIPVIFITAVVGAEDEDKGLQLGAVDYITKPIKPVVVHARVRTQLQAKQARDWMKNQNAMLEAEVSRRMADNNLIQKLSISALAHLAETRDPETGNHLRRTQGYVKQLAESLRNHPRFAHILTDHYIDLLTLSAPLHDIGKVGIPDSILLKRGMLTKEEWVVMRTHAKLGSDAIESAERDIEKPLEFLTLAKEIALYHHEKWNGKGYPNGLAGDSIPLSARLMAIADVFDALISVRVYKPAFSFSKSHDIIVEWRGHHFDPDITDAFLADYDIYVSIAQKYQGPEDKKPSR
jgi:putative two-component system response regulator